MGAGPDAASKPLVHAISRADWQATGDEVAPESLVAEGFIHLSRPDQIAWVANQRFAERDDMVLLVVDQELLPREIVWEDCYETGQDFPHLYAPLPRTAITDVIDYPTGPDGRFRTPVLNAPG